MNESDLYKLPKDLLVKLISQIRENSKEEFKEELKYTPLSIMKCERCLTSYVADHPWHPFINGHYCEKCAQSVYIHF